MKNFSLSFTNFLDLAISNYVISFLILIFKTIKIA